MALPGAKPEFAVAVMPSPSSAEAMFVSDVHLSADHLATAELFLTFLRREVATRVRRLYILGDLFEYWAGDDDAGDPFNRRIVDALQQVAQSGTSIAFMAGNRDFLVGDAFARLIPMEILPDPTEIVIQGTALTLSHGDILCTDDLAYQDFRARVRSQSWQREFLSMELSERKNFIGQARVRSEAEKQSKPMDIMDVNQDAVAAMLGTGAGTLIHGHTHRPDRHRMDHRGVSCERWVLSDWEAHARPPRGSGIVFSEGVLSVVQAVPNS